MRKKQVHRLLVETNSLGLKQEGFSLDEEERNLDLEGEASG
jgi:hypothetical protein